MPFQAFSSRRSNQCAICTAHCQGKFLTVGVLSSLRTMRRLHYAFLGLLAGSSIAIMEPAQSQRASCNPVASLSYGSFEGRYSEEYNITYFRKIPFAAPPVGNNRFRGPQPPLPITNGTYDSDGTFDMCPQRSVNGSEDCLFLGLYCRPWRAGQPLRPVMVDFYGGAFIEGGGSFSIPPSAYPVLNASSENDYISILPNYRVNAFGFLPGKKVAEDPESDLNPGLLDQRAVLVWIQQHIEAFGGDAGNVTIWGQSAGAGSVVAQAIANPDVQGGLITRALASSPFWPHSYRYDSPEAEGIYERFALLAGCSGPRSLQCLKTAKVQTLRNASLVIDDSHSYNTSSYTWAPVIDDVFLNVPLSQAAGNIRANLPGGAWGMYNTHEGENFVPPGLQNASTNASAPLGDGTSFNSSATSLKEWAAGFLPSLTSAQRKDLLTIYYPPFGTTETMRYNSTFVRAGIIYRDLILTCPAYWLGAAQPSISHFGEYTIPPATHGSDTQYWNQVNKIQTENPITYEGMAGAFASWFSSGNPNKKKLTGEGQAGVPILSSGQEWVVRMDDFGLAHIGQLEHRCWFWQSVANNVPV